MGTNYVGQKVKESGVYAAIARGIGRPDLSDSGKFRSLIDRRVGGLVEVLKGLEHPLQGFDTIKIVKDEVGRIIPRVTWSIEPALSKNDVN